MSLPNKGKILALDLGTRRTGLAVTDAKQRVAFSREALKHKNESECITQIVSFIKEENIVGILAGIPLMMSGEDSEQTKFTRELLEKIKFKIELPIQIADERWTSKLAANRLEKDKELDSESARILLETYLESA
jgi:putative Holliday junction resolvase